MKIMKRAVIFYYLFIFFIVSACWKERQQVNQPVLPPNIDVLLKEVNVPGLPSPFYHFEYNSDGYPVYVSYASGLSVYNIKYNGNKLSAMENNTMANKDKLEYSYNTDGKADTVNYTDINAVVYKRVWMKYENEKLIKITRERKTGGIFIIEKTMTFSYYLDGNLNELVEQRYSGNGQLESTYIDKFEQYDNKINVDGFSLVHNDFFEHLFLLPGLRLQKNNPAKLSRTGDGINYNIDYTYLFNDKRQPLSKEGDVVFTNGPNAGQRIKINSFFTYY